MCMLNPLLYCTIEIVVGITLTVLDNTTLEKNANITRRVSRIHVNGNRDITPNPTALLRFTDTDKNLRLLQLGFNVHIQSKLI